VIIYNHNKQTDTTKTEENKMSIFEIIAEETVKRFGHDDKAYKVYQDGIKH